MPTLTTPRFAAVDLLRGLAMAWMTLFHFSYDLQHFGYLHTNFYADPFWTVQRAAIVSLFVFCAGLGQAIAVQQGQSWGRFWKRWRLIACSALLVTVGSRLMFPDSFIYFGILHGMALMLLLARLLAGMGAWWWPLAALALAVPWLAAHMHRLWPALEFLNGPAFNWLGLISHKPITEDYAPLFPWLGVMACGMACGQWLLRRHGRALAVAGTWVQARAPLRGLAWMGRWSLSYYLLHQPVLIAVFSLIALLR